MVKLDDLPLDVLYLIALLLPKPDQRKLCMANQKTLCLANCGIAVTYSAIDKKRAMVKLLENLNTTTVYLDISEITPSSLFLPHTLQTLDLTDYTSYVNFDLCLLPSTIETLRLGSGTFNNKRRKGPSALSLLFRLTTLKLSHSTRLIFTKNDIPNVTRLVLAQGIYMEITHKKVDLSDICPDKLEKLDMHHVSTVVCVLPPYFRELRRLDIAYCPLHFPPNIRTLILPRRNNSSRILRAETMPKLLEQLSMNNYIVKQPLGSLKVLRCDALLQADAFSETLIDVVYITSNYLLNNHILLHKFPRGKILIFEENFPHYPITNTVLYPETTCIMIKNPILNFVIDPFLNKKIKIVLHWSKLVQENYSHFKNLVNEQIVIGDVPDFCF